MSILCLFWMVGGVGVKENRIRALLCDDGTPVAASVLHWHTYLHFFRLPYSPSHATHSITAVFFPDTGTRFNFVSQRFVFPFSLFSYICWCWNWPRGLAEGAGRGFHVISTKRQLRFGQLAHSSRISIELSAFCHEKRVIKLHPLSLFS